MASMPSPTSSPRLPSPPPIAEDQIGPTSPGVSLFEEHGKLPGGNSVDSGAARRIRPGTRAEDIAEGPPLVDIQDIDSAFQLTEHLKSLHWHHTHPPDSTTIHPITADVAKQLCTPPPGTSKDIWLYELCRFLIEKTNAIIVSFFADDPPCSAQTCPEMRASEWQYLCAVHDPPKSCAAIDYCCHTLDWAATTLTSTKHFPSRLGLGSGDKTRIDDKILQSQMKEIKNIFRRVYRIFAHAWFQHREMFWRVETKTGLYVFFKMVCDEYGIIESENYTIPPEAEGLEPKDPVTLEEIQGPSVLKRDQDLVGLGFSGSSPEKQTKQETYSMGDTTKRHRHTMSDFSSGVNAVIQEEAEEEESAASDKPSLDRQGTALKDTDTESSPDTPEQPSAEEPAPGINRSDTLKPPKEDADDDDDEAETTVLETPPSSESSEDDIESVTPQEISTTQAEDAAKPAAE